MDTHVAKILATVARIETTLDDLKEVSITRLNDHASRVRSLEMTRARQRGAYALVVVAAGSVGAWFGLRG